MLVFDMDGTLTESKSKIDQDFAKYLTKIFKSTDCSIVTGADYDSVKNQLGFELCYHVKWVFACGGAHVIQNGLTKYKSKWQCKPVIKRFCENFVRDSDFPHRTGNHFDDRIGMCNFSVVGQGASKTERRHYIAWDLATNERKNIAKKINDKFTGVVARVAGETGIDITHQNISKAKIIEYYNKDKLKFFGDKIKKGGNDYPLAKVLKPYQCFEVKNWQHTQELLRDMGF